MSKDEFKKLDFPKGVELPPCSLYGGDVVMPKKPPRGKAFLLEDGRKVYIHVASKVGRGYRLSISKFTPAESRADFEAYCAESQMVGYEQFKRMVVSEVEA